MGEKKIETSIERPDVYHHHDYRVFLKDWLSFIKRSKGLSIRQLSKGIGISHGYLSLVIDRKRNLSQSVLEKLVPLLGFQKDQVEHFQNMMLLSDSKDQKKRISAYKKMQKQVSYKEINVKEPVTFQYLDHWLHVAIREFATTGTLVNDAARIKKMIPYKVRLRDVKKSLSFLFENEFLIESENNILVPTLKDISCLGGVYQLSLGNFHKKMLDMAKTGIDVHNREERKQTGYTAAISREDFEQVKEILEEAKQKIKDLEARSDKKKNSVYHINLSAFPLIKEESS